MELKANAKCDGRRMQFNLMYSTGVVLLTGIETPLWSLSAMIVPIVALQTVNSTTRPAGYVGTAADDRATWPGKTAAFFHFLYEQRALSVSFCADKR